MKRIVKIAEYIGIKEKYIELFGNYKAKLSLQLIDRLKNKKEGKYVLVTAITPTPQGEGKTVTTIGLSMAFNRLKRKSIVTLRQPSLGPVFGIKGGGGGGGKSKIVPFEEFNLHLTGDVHAVGAAHNLLAAMIDNSIFHGNHLDIDINSIDWPRVVDISDRALRNVELVYGSTSRRTRFDITVASEVMAILALTSGIEDLKKRLGNIVIGFTKNGAFIRCSDLKVEGAMAVLLKDAIKPNLMQTIEETPCIVHTGPFANIAHGNSSILADKIAIKSCDYLITEAGFGADMGAEKFVDIKCRESLMKPDCVVLVGSVKALKTHSGKFAVTLGKKAPEGIFEENLDLLEKGCVNLVKQIENVKALGMEVVVCINHFKTDTKRELELVRKIAVSAGARDAVVSDLWLKGSIGGLDLARAVSEACKHNNNKIKFLYSLKDPIRTKIENISKLMYGADGVNYTDEALKKIDLFEKFGWGNLAICMAKTPLSLSADPNIKGRPAGFKIEVKDIKPRIGAGFLTPICGNISTMPGLPKRPIAEEIDIDKFGNIKGMF